MEEMIQLINNTGFPIVIALYSLIRLETTIKHNTAAIVNMANLVGVKTTNE